MVLRLVLSAVVLLGVTLSHTAVEATVPNASNKKVAFLFMARGHMYLEDIWHEFFRWNANPAHFNIHVHVHKGFTLPVNSFFHGKELSQESLQGAGKNQEYGHLWGNMGQVRAIRKLVTEALKDTDNEWFALMSETCLPLTNFNRMRNALLGHDKSIINACPHMGMKEMEGDTRWRPGLDNVGFKKEWWRKSGTWFALKRSHAQIFADETDMDEGWEKVPCCDEHFLPSLLAKHGMDNETSCTDGFTHVHWNSVISNHPVMYGSDDITLELFNTLRSTQSGFEAHTDMDSCSGMYIYMCVCLFVFPHHLPLQIANPISIPPPTIYNLQSTIYNR